MSRLKSPLARLVEPDTDLCRFFDADGKYEDTREVLVYCVIWFVERHIRCDCAACRFSPCAGARRVARYRAVMMVAPNNVIEPERQYHFDRWEG